MGFGSAVAGVAKNIVLGVPDEREKTLLCVAEDEDEEKSDEDGTAVDDRVRSLLSQMSRMETLFPEDRSDRVAELRDAIRDSTRDRAHKLFAKRGYGVAACLEVLRDYEREKDGEDVVHATLECVVAALTTRRESDEKIEEEREKRRKNKPTGQVQNCRRERDDGYEGEELTLAELCCEKLCEHTANVFQMLQLVSSTDFYVKYHATQILAAISSRQKRGERCKMK